MSRPRFFMVTAMLAIFALLLIGRVAKTMLHDHEQWQKLARRQQQRVVQSPGQRGSIFSADGYVMATSLDCVAVQIDTHLQTKRDIFEVAAAPLLGLSQDELRCRLDSGPRAVWLAKQVEAEIGEKVRILDPDAVVLVPDSRRVYPLGQVAAQIIGFVGREELHSVGRSGLEYSYNDDLTGEPEKHLVMRDAVQRQISLRKVQDGRPGLDLELTINAQLQERCEAALQATLDEVGGKTATAVVIDVHSGAVLALASLPSFDPGDPGRQPELWRLAPVQSGYEPGSVVKPVIAAIALSAGVIRPGDLFDCRSKGIEVAGKWIRDHADPGMYDVDEVVVYSANAGIVLMAERVEESVLWAGFDLFGFGRRTEVGFPAEAYGIMPAVDNWSKMSRAGFALGQELTVTPIQVACAYAAIANGGFLPKPTLVQRGAQTAATRARIMDEALAARLRSMLERVVTEGTGAEAQVSGYRVAGKTGTAQRAVGGAFNDENHAAWFAGFLPMPDPRYAVVVLVDEPETTFWASAVAAPAFARIGEAITRIFGLPPTLETNVRGEV